MHSAVNLRRISPNLSRLTSIKPAETMIVELTTFVPQLIQLSFFIASFMSVTITQSGFFKNALVKFVQGQKDLIYKEIIHRNNFHPGVPKRL